MSYYDSNHYMSKHYASAYYLGSIQEISLDGFSAEHEMLADMRTLVMASFEQSSSYSINMRTHSISTNLNSFQLIGDL